MTHMLSTNDSDSEASITFWQSFWDVQKLQTVKNALMEIQSTFQPKNNVFLISHADGVETR